MDPLIVAADKISKLHEEIDRLRAQPAIKFRWEENIGDQLLFIGKLCVGFVDKATAPSGNSRYRACYLTDNTGDFDCINAFIKKANAKAVLIAHVTKQLGSRK